jgi:hypothetical protein
VLGVRSRSCVEVARAAVLVRDTNNRRCGAAVFSWLLVAKKLRVVSSDVARMIGVVIWSTRGEECWHIEMPPLVRLAEEEEM